MSVEYKYIQSSQRLNVFGSNGVDDIKEIKALIKEGKIPTVIQALFYQRGRHSSVGMLFRGKHLHNLLNADIDERPNFRTILKKINERNSQQAHYAGLLVFAAQTKRFLFVLDACQYGLLGDYVGADELPSSTVVRAAREVSIEVTEKCLINLTPIEHDGTTYHSYLVISNHEFKAPRQKGEWHSYRSDKFALHPSVVSLFDQDPKLHQLLSPDVTDFEKLIDTILYS